MINRRQRPSILLSALLIGYLSHTAIAHAIAAGPLAPADSLAKLQVADGLQANVFAAEPLLLSPTNMDVDHRGRVWVCEVVNYRGRNGERPEGDRILILEDTDGDGQADKQTVYYQGRDVDSALGICVLGNQVIVSCAPNVFLFTDEDGDDKPDRKELLFSQVGDPQHDHSTHAFTFGPDGKYYWCVGNHGKHVHDKNGNLLTDTAGNEVIDNGKPYYGGMAFRCDTDGSHFEVLAHNFRNNYEFAVDSFGTLWQSDNDDDGNRAARINFVMEYGNYGYSDQLTGAGWRSPRTGMAPDTSTRHWHQNDPGVIPNLLQTGAGSPAGICVYEGDLLPGIFRNQMVHCDPGPNVVRAYPVKPDAAGYQATIVNIVDGKNDKWFRPADVCVAPDGSLMIADWYDPGVGGHAMGDTDKGRVFRVAPPGSVYKVPPVDVTTPESAIEALQSPNGSARYLAWTALHKWQAEAEPALKELYADDNPRFRARALWLLGKIKGRADHYFDIAMKDANPDIRITALRMMRQEAIDVLPYIENLSADTNPAVRRECLIALRNVIGDQGNAERSTRIANVWVSLANQHDGEDRWYLEAIGIAADGRWDQLMEAWINSKPDLNGLAARDTIWRSRSAMTTEQLLAIVRDPQTPLEDLPRYLRAIDFQDKKSRTPQLISLAFETEGMNDRTRLITSEALGRLSKDIVNAPEHREAVTRTVASIRGTREYVTLVRRLALESEYSQLVDIAVTYPEEQVGIDSILALLQHSRYDLIAKVLYGGDTEKSLAMTSALVATNDSNTIGMLTGVMDNSKAPIPQRALAARGVAKSWSGALDLQQRLEDGKLDSKIKDAVAVALHGSNLAPAMAAAKKHFPLPPAKDAQPLPTLGDLVKKQGEATPGKAVFETTGTCAKCHIVNGLGKEVGPDLSEIGSKLSRQAIFESILYPSVGISHNYETHTLVLESGMTVTGIIQSETDDEVSIKGDDAIARTYASDQIEEKIKQNVSLMPANLQRTMTVTDLVNLVEYLATLKKQ